MASKVTAVAAKLPPRRPRDSSDDFCSGSLGSIAGSAFESSAVDKASSAASAASKKPIETLEIASTASTKGSGSALSPSGRRPFRKRAGTFDFLVNLEDDNTTLNLSNTDDNSKAAMPPIEALQSIAPISTRATGGSVSSAGKGGRDRSNTLDHLDALGDEAGEAAAKIKVERKPRAGSISARSKDSDNSSHGTMTSQSQRFLLEAFMGDAEESLMQGRDRLGSFDARDRLGSFDARDRLGSFDMKGLGSLESRERLGSFGDRLTSLDSKEKPASKDAPADTVERGRSGSLHFRRERLESWGGMSELSVPHQAESNNDSGSVSAAALAAKLYTSIANDVFAAANLDGNESVSSFLVNDAVIPTRISVGNRSRLNSIASESSALDVQMPPETDLGADLQKYVSAAMASVGDQLAAVTAVDKLPNDQESVASSTLSPMIGAATDSKASSVCGRSRSNSLSSNLNFAVDFDAVQAAVDAAQTAAAAIDLASIANSTTTAPSANKKRRAPKLPTRLPPADVQSSSQPKPKPALPLQMTLPPIPKSKMDDKEMEILRERARAAAGYVPPSGAGTPLPPKKKAKLDPTLSTPGCKPASSYETPRTSNTSYRSTTPGTPYTPAMSTPGSAKSTVSKGQASQKWDSMFDYLILFIKERREIETKDLPEEDVKEWAWDGNVPTTYKTKDGKALGRWVNNQRSAKSKGNLKDDREKRLVDAGLKWSVLASNSWNEMLEELRVYVADQTKAGRKWDGNVPTNYRIKTKNPTGAKEDEDKNLGRWVNRQRSLYQAGKLRKDRQESLEKVGLKWSMLATTSWESMFETLCEYVRSKTKDGAEWDGNVPANYRTEDSPPRALGRWINRQRSAYGKDKLKVEYIEKLNSIGLKWSVHERRPINVPDVTRSVVIRPTPAVLKVAAAPRPPTAVPNSTVKPAAAATASAAASGRPPLPPSKPVATPPTAAKKPTPAPTPVAVGSKCVPVTTPVAKPTSAVTPAPVAKPEAVTSTATTLAPAPTPTPAAAAATTPVAVKAVTAAKSPPSPPTPPTSNTTPTTPIKKEEP